MESNSAAFQIHTARWNVQTNAKVSFFKNCNKIKLLDKNNFLLKYKIILKEQ